MILNLSELTVGELMLLQLEVNNAVVAIQTAALEDLEAGKTNPNFKMKQGGFTRYIKDQAGYEHLLLEAFEDEFESLCTETKVIPFTKAEKLMKEQLDTNDAAYYLNDLKNYLDKKQSPDKMIYSPEAT